MDNFDGKDLEVYGKSFLKKCGLTTKSSFQQVKDRMLWGTYGKPRDLNNLKWVKLRDCTTDHLFAILLEPHIPNITRRIINSILDDRSTIELENQRKMVALVGTRWGRKNYNEAKGPYNGYKVLAVTNTEHRHERHPEQVVYIGDNGKLWSCPLSEWPGNLVPEEEALASWESYKQEH